MNVAIVKDVVEIVAEKVMGYHVSPVLSVTLLSTADNQTKGGWPFREVIYLYEHNFYDLDNVVRRLENMESLVGIVFAGKEIVSERQLLEMMVTNKVDNETMLVHASPAIFVRFHFHNLSGDIRFSLEDTNPPWRWYGLKHCLGQGKAVNLI